MVASVKKKLAKLKSKLRNLKKQKCKNNTAKLLLLESFIQERREVISGGAKGRQNDETQVTGNQNNVYQNLSE